MCDPLLGDAVRMLGHWKRDRISLELPELVTWPHTKKTEKKDMSQMSWRSDGIQGLFVNWKAWTSSVHHGVHFRVLKCQQVRCREQSHDPEQE